MTDGDEIIPVDLSSAVLLVPGGAPAVRQAVARAIADGRYAEAVAEIDDPDLQTE
jgi:hypothetical protein